MTLAPDLDGDGLRDLVVVSTFRRRTPPMPDPDSPFRLGRLYVDALSGKDGRRLWTWARDLPGGRFVPTWTPCWWGKGPDGLPLLAVPIGGPPPHGWSMVFSTDLLLPPIVHVLEATTGRERHLIPGLYQPASLDLDHDGIDDLWGENLGRIQAFVGRPTPVGHIGPANPPPTFVSSPAINLSRHDPRWARPLPWVEPIASRIGAQTLLVAVGLALINVIIPVAILRLASRRRSSGLRLLMAMPIAAAIPLAVFHSRAPLLPASIGPMPGPARVTFFLATLAGLPIAAFAGRAIASPFRSSRDGISFVGLTVISTTIIGLAWLSWDARRMPPIEHYDMTGCYLLLLPGLYATGLLLLIARPLRPILRRVKHSRRVAGPARMVRGRDALSQTAN